MEGQLKLSGKVYKIFDTEKISEKFIKREFVIETDDKYPQKVKFELTQDNCQKIDKRKVGENVCVSFNVRGKEWENKTKKEMVYFVSLNAWRIETILSTENAPTLEMPSESDGDADELPF